MNTKTTNFGYQTISEKDKIYKVIQVFNSVAIKYDLMNDLMSIGLHRIWKFFAVFQAQVRSGFKVLDVAGGTGDLSKMFVKQVGMTGEVWLTDINESMLKIGRDKLLNQGILVSTLLCDAEKLPFPDNYFDCVSIAFGLRNMTRKDLVLLEMFRVLKPGGKLLILEFSKIWKPLEKLYDIYSFFMIPWLGKKIVHDSTSYNYLIESIRVHPDQESLKNMIENAGLNHVIYYNLAAGIAALHIGVKF